MPQAPPSSAAALWGKELQAWRSKRRLSQAALAARIFCNQSLISELEAGKALATRQRARELDEALNTTGVLERTLEYVRAEVTGAYHPDWFRNYVALEAKGTRLYEWYPYTMPSLLQTEAYMRAQFAGWHAPPRVDELTEARLSRQERLFGSSPLQLLAVLDEAVLRHGIGSPQVMADQLHHLLTMSSRSNVHVQVIPLGTYLPTALNDMLAFLDMPDGTRWFYTEGFDRGRYTADSAEVGENIQRYDAVRGSALPVAESRALIHRTLEETTNMPENVVDLSSINIFKSSYSQGGNACVGTSRDLLASGVAPIVDTKLGAASPVLAFSTAAFAAFVQAVKAGEFGTV